MATLVWEVVGRTWCSRISDRAEMLEQRIYPGDGVPDMSRSYRVRARMCSFGLECQAAGYACCWSGLNPNYDPFKERDATPEQSQNTISNVF